MEKNLRKCYEHLELPYSATIEDVEARKSALIKILNSQAHDNKVSNEKEIALVEKSANTICEEIKKNGIPQNEHRFESSKESIFALLVVLFFAVMVCLLSFNMFS